MCLCVYCACIGIRLYVRVQLKIVVRFNIETASEKQHQSGKQTILIHKNVVTDLNSVNESS